MEKAKLEQQVKDKKSDVGESSLRPHTSDALRLCAGEEVRDVGESLLFDILLTSTVSFLILFMLSEVMI